MISIFLQGEASGIAGYFPWQQCGQCLLGLGIPEAQDEEFQKNLKRRALETGDDKLTTWKSRRRCGCVVLASGKKGEINGCGNCHWSSKSAKCKFLSIWLPFVAYTGAMSSCVSANIYTGALDPVPAQRSVVLRFVESMGFALPS